VRRDLAKALMRAKSISALTVVIVAISILLIVLLGSQGEPTVVSVIGGLGSEVVFVLIGVVISLILVPTLDEELWTTDADDLRGTVPPTRLAEGIRAAVIAINGPETGEPMYREAFQPLLGARGLGEVRRDMRYQATITELDDHYSVVTDLTCFMVVPAGTETIGVSFAASASALNSEYGRSAVISRELVEPLVGRSWEEQVRELEDGVNLEINGEQVSRQGDIQFLASSVAAGSSDVARFNFKVVASERQRDVYARLQTRFWLPLGAAEFPVVLGDYFCFGNLDLSLGLNSERDLDIRARVFLAGSGQSQYHKAATGGRVLVHSDKGLLWPGSGAILTWNPA